VETFLRRFKYTLDVKAPPPDRDAVDFFLFDLKEGYSDYFASAMVVMLRLQGIPARLAMGYVSGKFDNTTRKFVVTEEEAHSWPEVYFPNFGWVPFEPSSYRPPIVRSEDPTVAQGFDDSFCYDEFDSGCEEFFGEFDPLANPQLQVDQGTAARGPLGFGRGLRLPNLLPFLLVIPVGLAVYWGMVAWGDRHAAPREAIRRYYWRMLFLGRLLGHRPRLWAGPGAGCAGGSGRRAGRAVHPRSVRELHAHAR